MRTSSCIAPCPICRRMTYQTEISEERGQEVRVTRRCDVCGQVNSRRRHPATEPK